MRAEVGNYGSWVCALIDGINAACVKLEPGFKPMGAGEVAEVVMRAVPTTPYE